MSEFERQDPWSDAHLVRRMDGEGGVVGTASGPRLWELEEASERFSASVSVLEAPALPRLEFRRRTWWRGRAAAVVLLLGASSAAAALPPARAFLSDGWDRVRAWVAGETIGAGEAGTVEPGSGTGTARVGVIPETTSFVIEVETPHEGGVMHLRRAEGSELTVSAREAEVFVLPDRIRLVAPPAGLTRIEVAVPQSLVTLVLRIEGRGERRIDLRTEKPPLEVPLGEG